MARHDATPRHGPPSLSAKITPKRILQLHVHQQSPLPSTSSDQKPTQFNFCVIPLTFTALVCISWTVFLIILTIKPNATANHLMDTAEFDDGAFWFIIEPETKLMAISVLALAGIVLGYFYILVQTMLQCGRQAAPRRSSKLEPATRTISQRATEAANQLLQSRAGLTRFQRLCEKVFGALVLQ